MGFTIGDGIAITHSFVRVEVTFRVAHGGATVTCDKFVFNTLQHSDYFLTSVVKIRVKECVSGS